MIYVGDKVMFSRRVLNLHRARHAVYIFCGISTGPNGTDYLFKTVFGNNQLSLINRDLNEIIEIRSNQPTKAKIC